MEAGDSDAPSLPVRPDPFALIVSPVAHAAGVEALETAMRRMGLRPERVDVEHPAVVERAPALRLTVGEAAMRIAAAEAPAFGIADPRDPATNSLAPRLPTGWRKGGRCWIVVPDRGHSPAAAPDDTPAALREFFKSLVLLTDLFDASHLFWSPARLWSDAAQFRGAIAEMLESGMPPVLHLVAFRRHEAGGGDIVRTHGLAVFAGQELESRVPPSWTIADMIGRLVRIALDVLLNGPVHEGQRTNGLEPGERVSLSPRPGRGGAPSLVRVEFGVDG